MVKHQQKKVKLLKLEHRRGWKIGIVNNTMSTYLNEDMT